LPIGEPKLWDALEKLLNRTIYQRVLERVGARAGVFAVLVGGLKQIAHENVLRKRVKQYREIPRPVSDDAASASRHRLWQEITSSSITPSLCLEVDRTLI